MYPCVCVCVSVRVCVSEREREGEREIVVLLYVFETQTISQIHIKGEGRKKLASDWANNILNNICENASIILQIMWH